MKLSILILTAGLVSLPLGLSAAEPVHSPKGASMAASLKRIPVRTEWTAKTDSRLTLSPKASSLKSERRAGQDSNRVSGYYPGNAKSPHLHLFQVAPSK